MSSQCKCDSFLRDVTHLAFPRASLTPAMLTGRDTDGYGVFTVDQVSGLIRTKAVLDHEERAIYRLAVAATDSGIPPKETVRVLRVEVLDLNDNRPTFTSSSLVFKVGHHHDIVKRRPFVKSLAIGYTGGREFVKIMEKYKNKK